MSTPYMKLFTESGIEIYSWDSSRLPILTRRVSSSRKDQQGTLYNKIECTLTGYFYEDSHDMRVKYSQLMSIGRNSRLVFVFHDGQQEVINKKCYMNEVSEPQQWGEYICDFTMGFYYFEDHEPSSSDIKCIYVNSIGESYTFSRTPTWSFSINPGRSDDFSNTNLPSGISSGSMVNVSLSGTIFGTSSRSAYDEAMMMVNAFKLDGQLTYGNFSSGVRVGKINVPEVTPYEMIDFSIPFSYYIGGLMEFKSRRSFTRSNSNPIIHEFDNCNVSPIVVRRYQSSKGQTVSYSMSARGQSISVVRSLLLNEMTYLVIPGGTELPGGKEEWDDQEVRVSVNFDRYYEQPVLSNLGENLP